VCAYRRQNATGDFHLVTIGKYLAFLYGIYAVQTAQKGTHNREVMFAGLFHSGKCSMELQ
jgi:hypothetical protein